MNKQINCEIIQDLMPLVLDDACSPGSRRAVEEHIAGCENCAEVFAAMKSEIPKPAADENGKKHFVKAMKKTRRKTWLMIGAFCLAAILLSVGVMLYFFPDYSKGALVPKTWIRDAQLLRTTEGDILLKVIPDYKYVQFLGIEGIGIERGRNNEDPDTETVTIAFRYPAAAIAQNGEIPSEHKMEWVSDTPYLTVNNEWIISLSAESRLYYEDGKAVFRNNFAILNDDGSDVGENSDLKCHSISLEHFQVGIIDDPNTYNTFRIIHNRGEEIPLCTKEIEEKYQELKYHPEDWGFEDWGYSKYGSGEEEW